MTEPTRQKRPLGRPRKQGYDSPTTTVQALDRGLSLLQSIYREGQMTLTDLALTVGMPPSTTYRLLITLQKHGFTEFDEVTQLWSIGIEAFRVGSAYIDKTSLVEAARIAMRNLMENTGETSNLAIEDQGDVVFISQVETNNPIRAFFKPGTRGPMHASGIGKALLASMKRSEVEKVLRIKGLPGFTDNTITSPDRLFPDLQETLDRGWSFDDEERYSGMRCIAATIYNGYSEAIAGISISGPTVRFSDKEIFQFGPVVKKAADSVTELIGGKIPG